MSERLLSPSAKVVLGVVGALVVLYGTTDVVWRVAHRVLGAQAATTAFGPAILAVDAMRQQSATSTDPITPVKISIPSLGVSAAVEAVGEKSDGSMATPSTFSSTAWYKLGSKPGAPGNAVIAGHVNNALTKAGVFEHLNDVQLGDIVVLSDAQGKTLRFAVRDIEDYTSADAPLSAVFATGGPSQLALITCAGDWDPKARSYDHRLVVYAGLLAQ